MDFNIFVSSAKDATKALVSCMFTSGIIIKNSKLSPTDPFGISDVTHTGSEKKSSTLTLVVFYIILTAREIIIFNIKLNNYH